MIGQAAIAEAGHFNKTQVSLTSTPEKGISSPVFHMDQFFANIQGCSPDVEDIEFNSAYVLCYRYGVLVALLDAKVLSIGDPAEKYRVSILAMDNPDDYPVIEEHVESYIDVTESYKTEILPSGAKFYTALALNWARDLTP